MIQFIIRDASGRVWMRLNATAVHTREWQDQQISELRITIIAPKDGTRMEEGGRGGGNFFYGMKEWYGRGLHVNFRISSGYIFYIRILYFWRSAVEKSPPP